MKAGKTLSFYVSRELAAQLATLSELFPGATAQEILRIAVDEFFVPNHPCEPEEQEKEPEHVWN